MVKSAKKSSQYLVSETSKARKQAICGFGNCLNFYHNHIEMNFMAAESIFMDYRQHRTKIVRQKRS